MKQTLMMVAALASVAALAAGKKAAVDPVAEGYPAWSGVTAKNYIGGRVLTSEAELRQRVATIVVEFDATKSEEQLELTGGLAAHNGFFALQGHGASGWENTQIPRDIVVIFVAKNMKSREPIEKTLKIRDQKKPGITALVGGYAPVYVNVTYEGAPDNGGKLPFVYALGYEGKDPIFKEAFDAKTTKVGLNKAITEQKKKLGEAELNWRPFYGYVSETKYFKDIEKALAKGKPLDAAEAKLKKSVKGGDAARTKEAQMLYDALVQTRAEMIWLAMRSYSTSPHVAAYSVSQVLKYWPKSKKQLDEVNTKLKAYSSAQPLIKMYAKIMEWNDPNFSCKNAAEAKKIVAELEKMKKALTPLKENAQNIQLQNSALLVETMLDELITIIPAKVAGK